MSMQGLKLIVDYNEIMIKDEIPKQYWSQIVYEYYKKKKIQIQKNGILVTNLNFFPGGAEWNGYFLYMV